MDDLTKKYLFDIQESILGIQSYLGENPRFSDLEKSRMLRKAIERELETIGEALNRALKMNPALPISNARKIVNMRNFVAHDYDKVDLETVWLVLQRHLPILKTEVETLLNH